MKRKESLKARIKSIKNKAKKMMFKNEERIANFIKATIEQKPLLSLFNGLEKGIENTFNRLENKAKKRKVKWIETKKENQRIREHILREENEIPHHIFLGRLEALKKQLPIKRLNQDTKLER